VLEFASKHNLKAILRYWTGRQRWSPFATEPVEFVELNFDFHPRWIRRQITEAGFQPGRTLAVSHFRLPLVKKIVPTGLLVAVDSLIQRSGDWWQLTPSVFLSSQAPGSGEGASPGNFFACPDCFTPIKDRAGPILSCPNPTCSRGWRFEDGLYDFKEPVAAV
jgi:hypothetical protein